MQAFNFEHKATPGSLRKRKTVVARTLLLLWILAATLALARLLLAHPDFGPQVPLPVSLWLVELYGSHNGEELADLEALIVLVSAFVLVTPLSLTCVLVWRRLSKQ